MKIVTVLGTRPEIIRLCRIVEKLDALCDQVVVHTGQNYDDALDGVFFRQLGVRPPDRSLGARGSTGEQVGRILPGMEQVLLAEKPDRFLVLGDTNSSLAAIVAKRLGIPVFHMEAGNRCYDDRVPEEVNRRIIDHASDVLLPYTERSRQNLLREGIPGERIYVTGNPIYEVLRHFGDRIARSSVLADLRVEAGRYFLVTMHRAENVDVKDRLESLTRALGLLHERYSLPVIVSTHPRTKGRMERFGLAANGPGVRFLPPFGFFEFVALERNAFCVLSDSGTVQEECAILGVPNVTVRDVTERPETLECGSNMLSGADAETVARCVRTVTTLTGRWKPPAEYVKEDVSETVIRILTGYLHR